MADIFLSHSSADNDAADQIKSWLEHDRESWSVFLDKHPHDGILAGQSWQDRLRSELQSCRLVLAIITPDWLASRWCFTEAVTATFRGKDFIGVVPGDIPDGALDVAPPIVHERQRQPLDLATGAGWEKLLHALDRSGLDPSHWFSIPEGVGPYPGFVAFEEKDAGVFFGRDQEITEYLDALNLLKAPDRAQALVISGSSGSGKSSLLKAGLIPRLRQQPDWLIIPPFDPSREPIHALFSVVRAAAQATGADIDLPLKPPQTVEDLTEHLQHSLRAIEEKANAWLLLPLDQAEVLLASSQERGETDAARLLAAVGRLLATRTRKLVAVLTIRTEFAPALEHALPSGVRLNDRSLYSITALSEIIEKPAARFGIELEEGLTGRMVEDTRGTGALPLLAYTLSELNENYGEDNHLTVAEYEQLGGVEGAIEKKLHQALSDPRPTSEELAAFRRAFVRHLVRVDESAVEGERYLRTAVARDALPADANRLVDRLLEARLLVSAADGTIGIAHERLIRDWADVPLQTWLAEDRGDRKLIDNLNSFLAAHRDGGPLLSEKPLLDAKDFLERDRALKEDEPELAQFIEDSVSAEQSRQRRQKWQFRGAAAASLIFLAVAIGAVWFFLEAQKQARLAEQQTNVANMERDRAKEQSELAEKRRLEARGQADLAMARQLSAQSELQRPNVGAMEESVLLALESLRLSGTSEATIAVRKSLTLISQSKLTLTHEKGVREIAMSADGRYLAIRRWDTSYWTNVWMVKSGEESLRFSREQAITHLSLHPQGLFLATIGRDGDATLWNLESGREIYHLGTDAIEFEHSTSHYSKTRRSEEKVKVTAIAFSNNGNHLAIALAGGHFKVIDIRSKKTVVAGELHKPVSQVQFSPEDHLVAALCADKVVIWNLVKREQHGTIPVSANDLQFDSTGRYIATTDSKHKARLWDAESQKLVAEFRQDRRIDKMRLIPNSSRLITIAKAGDTTKVLIEVHDLESDQTLASWVLDKRISSLAVSDDGKYVATADFGKVARLWKTVDGSEAARFPHEAQITAITFDPKHEQLAVGSVDGIARLWELRGGSPVAELELDHEVRHFALSEDGASIVTVGGLRGTAKVWQVPEGRQLSIHKFDGLGNAAAFAADGKHLIQTTRDKVFWTDLTSKTIVREIQLEGVKITGGYSAGDAAISGDSRWVHKNINKINGLWQIGDGSGKLRKIFPANVRSVAFTPDSSTLITVANAEDPTKTLIELHDLESDQKVASWVTDERVHFLAISSDSRLLAIPETAFSRGWNISVGYTTFRLAGSTISIVRLTTGDLVTRVNIPNVAVPNQIKMVAFSPDGQFLAAGLADGETSVIRITDSEEIARLPASGKLSHIAFTQDQAYLVTAGAYRFDGFVRFWRWQITDLYAAACARITRNLNYWEWSKYFSTEPYRVTCENLPPHPSLLEQARLLAERGEIDKAKAILDQALRLGAKIDSAPDQWIDEAAAVGLVDDGARLAKTGRIEAALAAFTEARRLDPKVDITFVAWNEVCWQGALRRSAEAVIEACDRAVERAPENGGVRDSRGIVRAQLGDFKGAIADFQVYLAWAPNNNRSDQDISKRKQWIEHLRRGVDPFDADTLKALQ